MFKVLPISPTRGEGILTIGWVGGGGELEYPLNYLIDRDDFSDDVH